MNTELLTADHFFVKIVQMLLATGTFSSPENAAVAVASAFIALDEAEKKAWLDDLIAEFMENQTALIARLPRACWIEN